MLHYIRIIIECKQLEKVDGQSQDSWSVYNLIN